MSGAGVAKAVRTHYDTRKSESAHEETFLTPQKPKQPHIPYSEKDPRNLRFRASEVLG